MGLPKSFGSRALSSAGRDQDKRKNKCERGKAKVQLQQHARLLSGGRRAPKTFAPTIERPRRRCQPHDADSTANPRQTSDRAVRPSPPTQNSGGPPESRPSLKLRRSKTSARIDQSAALRANQSLGTPHAARSRPHLRDHDARVTLAGCSNVVRRRVRRRSAAMI